MFPPSTRSFVKFYDKYAGPKDHQWSTETETAVPPLSETTNRLHENVIEK